MKRISAEESATIELSQDVVEDIHAMADKKGVTTSVLLREWIAEHKAAQEPEKASA